MPADNPKLGFIGAGMMSSAMINGIIAAKVRATTVGPQKGLNMFATECSLHRATSFISELCVVAACEREV